MRVETLNRSSRRESALTLPPRRWSGLASAATSTNRGVVFAIGMVAVAAGTFGQASNSATNLLWRDARDLIIEGRGWPDTKDFYDRLPARAEKLVRQNVWNLGHDSAGMCVRFVTDATT